jgi:type I restriction-modification system DNA methylase subunit
VCDPVCGSGAFLIEVFDFFYAEAQRVNTQLSRLCERLKSRNCRCLKAANKGKELTDLDGNIKCSNLLVDDQNVAGAAAFDWAAAFPEVMEQGDFDIIVGNPPYVRQVLLLEAMKAFLAKNYTVVHGRADLYLYSTERSVNLLKNGGLYSIIAANKWMRASNSMCTAPMLKSNTFMTRPQNFKTFP